MWTQLNTNTSKPSASSIRRMDFSSTWDVPTNPAKAKCISDQEFLKLLSPDLKSVIKGCAHETRRIKCPCGKCISATQCIHCSVTFCSENCGKTAAASDSMLMKDEDFLNEGDKSSEALFPADPSRDHENSGDSVPNLLQFGGGKDSSNVKVDTLIQTPNTGKNSENNDSINKCYPALEAKVNIESNGTQKAEDSSLNSEFLRKITDYTAKSRGVGVNMQKQSKLQAYNKKLVAGRGRSRGQSISSESSPSVGSSVTRFPFKNVPGCKDQVSESSIVSEMAKSNITSATKSGQYDDVEDPIVVEHEDCINPKLELGKYLSCFAEQPRLESLEGKLFVVTHAYAVNRIHIVSCDIVKNRKDDLLDDVNDACKDAPSISNLAKVGDLVCAPSDKGFMERAIVIQKLPDLKFRVKFLDFGGTKIISKSDMYLLVDDLLQTALLGYEVKIENLEEEPPRMLGIDISKKVLPWMLLQKKLKIAKVKKLEDTLYEAQFSSKRFENFAAQILKFQVWTWEILFQSGKKNDFDMLNGKRYLSDCTLFYKAKQWERDHYLTLPMSYFPDHSIMMECSRINEEVGIVTFTNIESKFFTRELNILQLQINRYVDRVNALQHYPKIGENFLLLPDPKLSCEKKWRRATRVDTETVYCVDTDEYFPLKMDHGTRFLCPDFLEVPTFVIHCKVVGIGQLKLSPENDAEMKETIKKTFVSGGRYPVNVVGYDENTGLFKIKTDL